MMKSNHVLYNVDTKNYNFPNSLDIVRILVIDGFDVDQLDCIPLSETFKNKVPNQMNMN